MECTQWSVFDAFYNQLLLLSFLETNMGLDSSSHPDISYVIFNVEIEIISEIKNVCFLMTWQKNQIKFPDSSFAFCLSFKDPWRNVCKKWMIIFSFLIGSQWFHIRDQKVMWKTFYGKYSARAFLWIYCSALAVTTTLKHSGF